MKNGNNYFIWNNKKFGNEQKAILSAYWEVACDPVSDDYSPDDISAEELFQIWANKVDGKYENQLVPIYWFVVSNEDGIYEGYPFQFKHIDSEDFLTHFSWPRNEENSELLNWLTLPVADKGWNKKQASKGGFIQEYTGWKPSILQPYIYLPTLLNSLRG